MLSTFHADLAAFGFGFHPPSPLQPAPGTDIPAETHWNAAEMVLHIKQCAGATRKTKKEEKATLAAVPKVPKERIEPKKGQKGVSGCMDGLIINSSSNGGSIIIILVVI